MFSKTPIAFSVCRVCLAFDIKMCRLGPQTTKIFEKITKTKIRPKDGKPQTVCYICFSLLKRCLLFANMSHLTEGILKQVLQTNPMLTRQLVMQHTEGIVSTFYTTPILACSISGEEGCIENVTTTSIVKGSVITTYRQNVNPEPVSMKTENIDEGQVIVEMPGVNIKKEQGSISENESTIQVKDSVTREIVTDEHVTVKTEKIDEDQVIVETSEVNIKKEKEQISENESDNEDDTGLITNVTYKDVLENEQLIFVGNQTNKEQEVDLEQIVSRIAQNIENEQAVFGNEVIVSENEPVYIKQGKDDSTIHKIQSNEEINTSKDRDQPNKRKIDDLISELTQEIEDGIKAIENEALIEQDETGSEDCIIILSDEDDISECDERVKDVTIIEDEKNHETQKPSNKVKHKKAKLHL